MQVVVVSAVLVVGAFGALAASLWLLWRSLDAPYRPTTRPPVLDPIGGPLGTTSLAAGASLAGSDGCVGGSVGGFGCSHQGGI